VRDDLVRQSTEQLAQHAASRSLRQHAASLHCRLYLPHAAMARSIRHLLVLRRTVDQCHVPVTQLSHRLHSQLLLLSNPHFTCTLLTLVRDRSMSRPVHVRASTDWVRPRTGCAHGLGVGGRRRPCRRRLYPGSVEWSAVTTGLLDTTKPILDPSWTSCTAQQPD